MWLYVKRYRTALFHASYGIPFAVMALADNLRMIDLTPFFSPKYAPLVGSAVAVLAVTLHFFADAHRGSLRDDGSAGVNVSIMPPVQNPVPPDTIVNTEPPAQPVLKP